MKKVVVLSGALFAVLLLGGCQTTDQGSGVQPGATVTRFHLGQPIARGEIRVEPGDPAQADSLEFSQQAAAVERELGRLGWTVARANARSEQVAVVRVSQGSREAMRQRSGLSVGVGVGATIPIGGNRSGEIVVTELAIRIQRRSDATVAWEGRAELEARADSPLANPVAAVDRLAEALFRDFPGESGRTMRIR